MHGLVTACVCTPGDQVGLRLSPKHTGGLHGPLRTLTKATSFQRLPDHTPYVQENWTLGQQIPALRSLRSGTGDPQPQGQEQCPGVRHLAQLYSFIPTLLMGKLRHKVSSSLPWTPQLRTKLGKCSGEKASRGGEHGWSEGAKGGEGTLPFPQSAPTPGSKQCPEPGEGDPRS